MTISPKPAGQQLRPPVEHPLDLVLRALQAALPVSILEPLLDRIEASR